MAYGARTASSVSTPEQQKAAASKSGNPIENTLDYLATLQVPHSWFTSFYITSVSCSLLWAADYALSGPLSWYIVKYTNITRGPSMTFHQVAITWLAVLAQGSRRLYECNAFSRPSKSTMWIGHWALGIAFYIGLSVAVWIEGVRTLQHHKLNLLDLALQPPSLRTFVSLVLFFFASGIQHDCHAYLASLKPTGSNNKDGKADYKLPNHPAFNYTVTPHYFAECLIYLAIAGLAAPGNEYLNGTIACALLFVAVNLGVTAHGTHEWYEQKFGKSALEGRSKMVPFLY